MSDLERYIVVRFKLLKSNYEFALSDKERSEALISLREMKLLAVMLIGSDFANSLDNL